jgi:hypothetical protein
MYCYDKKCYRCTAIYQYTLYEIQGESKGADDQGSGTGT